MEGYTAIGKLGKSHGVKGEVKLTVEEKYWEDFETVDVVFVEQRGKPTPYFIESLRGVNGHIVKFEDIDTPEDANQYLRMKVLYLRNQDVLVEEERNFVVEEELEYGAVIGFTIEDANFGQIGTIESIEAFPQQEMAILNYKKEQVLIPLIDAFIIEINSEQKIIKMELPEGLLGL